MTQQVPIGDGAEIGGIVAHDLRRTFDGVVAVDGMSLRVAPGRVTALIGPNGAGKTTFLLMAAGLLAPESGALFVAGADPRAMPHHVHASIGWMPDGLGTWDTLTCAEVLSTFAEAYRVASNEIPGRVQALLAQVHLSEFAAAPARVLSRGQKQRLSLARTLVHDPQVLLLDEPASGLDPRSRVDLRNLLRELAAGGKAVLVSSHVLAELDDLVDEAIFVSRGRTVAAESVAAAAGRTRQWVLSSLDTSRLQQWLIDHGVQILAGEAHRPDDVHVAVGSREQAAQLLHDLVSDGVPVVSSAAASGALEEVYLGLEHDRR